MLIDFYFIGKKTDFGRVRRRKATAFSFAKAGIDENIGLPGQQRAVTATVGDNHKVAPVILIDFYFIGKKTDFGRVRRRKAAAFSFAKAGIDENIGLPGQQRAVRCRSTV